MKLVPYRLALVIICRLHGIAAALDSMARATQKSADRFSCSWDAAQDVREGAHIKSLLTAGAALLCLLAVEALFVVLFLHFYEN